MKRIEIPVIDMVRTGARINAIRKKCGISVRELQSIFGFATPQAIYKWQQGTALPTVDNLLVLSTVFGVSIDDLLVIDGGEGENIGWSEAV